MKALINTINTLALPIVFINNFGVIAAGIWLLILGDWEIIIHGLVILLAGYVLLLWIFTIGLIFVMPSAYFIEKNNQTAGMFFGFINVLFTVVVIVVWCVIVLFYFLKLASYGSFYPTILWSYCITTSPLAYLAYKDLQGGNEAAMILTFFAELSYLIIILGFILFGMTVTSVWILFSSFMLLGLVIQLIITGLKPANSV